MKLSEMEIGTTRINVSEKQFPAQEILIQSGQIIQYSSGIYGYNNIPLKVKQNIENIVRDELNRAGCVEVSLPMLQPESIWKESGRFEKYTSDDTMMTVNDEYSLAPTAEEAAVVFIRNKINSYKDLPVTIYQIGEKFRNELRTRGYLLRGKSFTMMDAYSFANDSEETIQIYEKIKKAYIEIFRRLDLDIIPVAADNGNMGGKKSEEFMLLSELGEDTILYDEETGKALNKEILDREDYKEYLKKEYGITDIKTLKPKRTIELGHIFQLGTKYSEVMNDAIFTDENSNNKPYYMGCYGIGISRVLATIYEKNIVKNTKGKVDGIALPTNIAPYILQIIPKSDNERKCKEANEIYEKLQELHIDTIIDDRKEQKLGSQIKDAKVLGTPYLAIFGEHTEAGKVEIENSKTGEKKLLSKGKLIELLRDFQKEKTKIM